MIINATPSALLRPAPVLLTKWQEKLCDWLKIILQPVQKVFPLQFEMLDTDIALEEEIRLSGTKLGELKQLIRKFKEIGDLPNIIKTQKEATGNRRLY